MDRVKSRQELAIAREKCDKDLLFFTRFFFKEIRGKKFSVNDHHRALCDEFDAVENYQTKLLNINIPPRHSKTELMLNFIARGIGKNPSSNWLYVTASDDLRAEVSIRIRDIISHPYFRIMYGVGLKKDQNSKNLWRTTSGGGLKTASIFGQITGFGAGQIVEQDKDLEDYVRDFEGCQCWDDLNKMNDSQSENANNKKVSDVVFNTLLSRENSGDTPIIHIQQRAGMSDVTANLKDHFSEEDDRNKYIVMPVIKDGVPLWESKLSVEQIEELRTSPKTSHVFLTQYMQEPVKREGICFPLEDLNRFNHKDFNPDSDMVDARISFVDPADKGDDFLSNPYASLIGDKIYIHDVVFTKDEVKISAPQVVSKSNEYRVDQLIVESNMGGSMYAGNLTGLNRSVRPRTMFARGNKHTRIITMSGFIKKYCYFRDDYDKYSDYGMFMENLTKYLKDGSSDHDDAPDSITGLCVFIKRNFHWIYKDAPDDSEDGYGKVG